MPAAPILATGPILLSPPGSAAVAPTIYFAGSKRVLRAETRLTGEPHVHIQGREYIERLGHSCICRLGFRTDPFRDAYGRRSAAARVHA